MKRIIKAFIEWLFKKMGYQLNKIPTPSRPLSTVQKTYGPFLSHSPFVDIFEYASQDNLAHKTKQDFSQRLRQGFYQLQRFPCPICETEQFTPVALSKEGFAWGLCNACGLLQCYHRLSNEALNQFYASGDYQVLIMGNISDNLHYQIEYQINALYFIDIFEKLAIPLENKHILEIGCGSGGILRALQEKGAKVCGFDIDPHRVAAGKKYIKEIYAADAMDEKIQLPEKLDYIILSNILEHLTNPRVFLQTLWHKLNAQHKENTRLIIDVPNLETAKEYSPVSFSKFLHIAHLWYFNSITIERLLNVCGFEIETIFSRHSSFSIVAKMLPSSKMNLNNAFWNSISSINYANFAHEPNNVSQQVKVLMPSVIRDNRAI